MIETNQYRKGIIAITRKAAKLNPQLGDYKTHYINEKARFVVHLTNGKLEIDIWVARECEEDPDAIFPWKLKKAAQSYWNEDNEFGRPKTTLHKWNSLFADEKENTTKNEWNSEY